METRTVTTEQRPRRPFAAPAHLTPFAFEDALVRVWEDAAGEPWFVALDICRALGIEKTSDAVSVLDDDEKITLRNADGNPRAGIPHTLTLISESGLYALVFRSRKPRAREFSRWVRREVLPGIRRTGRYGVQDAAAVPPEALRLPAGKRLGCLRMAVRLCQSAGAPDRVEEFYGRLCAQLAGGAEEAAGAGLSPSLSLEGRLREFIGERVAAAPGARLPSRRFYEAFCRWLEERGALSPTLTIKRVTRTVRLARLLPIAHSAPSVVFGEVSLRSASGPAPLPLLR